MIQIQNKNSQVDSPLYKLSSHKKYIGGEKSVIHILLFTLKFKLFRGMIEDMNEYFKFFRRV